MKIVKEKIVLQYPMAGTIVGEYQSGQVRVTQWQDAGKFVALDSASGGYPYSVDIDQAHDFDTPEKARQYARNEAFIVRLVKITYEVSE